MSRLIRGVLLVALPVVVLATPEPLGAQATRAALDTLAFMSGTWCSEPDAGGTVLEEHYTTPSRNLILGVSRFLRTGETLSYEWSRIERRDGTVVLTPSPSGQAPVPFTLTEVAPGHAVFENPEHDFPVRIIYRRTETGLTARIEGRDGSGREWGMAPCRGAGRGDP